MMSMMSITKRKHEMKKRKERDVVCMCTIAKPLEMRDAEYW